MDMKLKGSREWLGIQVADYAAAALPRKIALPNTKDSQFTKRRDFYVLPRGLQLNNVAALFEDAYKYLVCPHHSFQYLRRPRPQHTTISPTFFHQICRLGH